MIDSIAKSFNKININTKRNLAYLTLLFVAANNIYFIKPMLVSIANYQVVGFFDVASIVGFIGIFSLWMFYKRRM